MTSLFVFGLVILCLVYFLFVVVWLSVPVQLIAWEDSSLKITYRVSSGMSNLTHSTQLVVGSFSLRTHMSLLSHICHTGCPYCSHGCQ